MTAALLLFVGAGMLVGGVTVLLWPAGVALAGLLMVLAGIDLRR